LPLVTSFFGSVIIAGRERKSFCGAFKAQKSGGKAGDGTPPPLVTLSGFQEIKFDIQIVIFLGKVLRGFGFPARVVIRKGDCRSRNLHRFKE